MTGSEATKVQGLDTLRFVAALWVVFGHCGAFPLTEGLDRTSVVGLMVQGVYGNLFAAVPAVIVFFVISGFCIHYPNRQLTPLKLGPYFARRYLRIGIPLVVAVGLSRPFGVTLTLFQNSILWTLAAELVYYTIYPLLLRLRRRISWDYIISSAYILSYCVVFARPQAEDYSPYGVWLNWIIALPCWLLGCRLAEIDFGRDDAWWSFHRVWYWRLGVWFLSSLCSVMRFHCAIGYPWTLNVFAVAVYYWLQVEIVSYREKGWQRVWEWAGLWSYSLYLMHMIANSAYGLVPAPNLGFNLNWAQRFLFILATSYFFYLLVEKPGHVIARHVSLYLGGGHLRNSGGLNATSGAMGTSNSVPPSVEHDIALAAKST